MLNQGDGQLRPGVPSVFSQDAPCEDQGSIFFDADNDGDLDLYVASGSVEVGLEHASLQDRLYLNGGIDSAGDILWSHAADRLPNDKQSSSAVAAADFDQDGDLDLCVGTRVVPDQYPLSGASRLLENRNGSFVDVTAQRAPGLLTAGMVTSLLWSDANGDGQLDLWATCEYGPVRYFLNQSGQLTEHTEAAGLSAELGWWNSIVAADVDQDGDMDYAVGNFGRNTKYHPTPEAPQLIFFGDFAGDGISQIVEAKSAVDGLLPTRGRSCSSNAMPFLKERFTSFHSFASATLDQIYTEDKLAQAVRVSVNRVESVILVNDGAAHFSLQPLPDLAQMAPVFGLQFMFANDDGAVDLLVTQNFNSPQRETGRMNGGLGALLLGNGDGSFREIWPDESGVSLPGDSKAASCIDLNGDHWQDLFVTTNNGTPVAVIRADPPTIAPFVLLQFRDESRRQSPVGVIVRATYANGTVCVAESSAGCGYLSQVPPQVVLPHSNEVPIQQLNVTWPNGQQQTIDMLHIVGVSCIISPEVGAASGQ